jgi:hypothetical protein
LKFPSIIASTTFSLFLIDIYPSFFSSDIILIFIEIENFASDISKTFKNIALNSNLTAERRGSAEKESLFAENSGFQAHPLSSASNLAFPENGFDGNILFLFSSYSFLLILFFLFFLIFLGFQALSTFVAINLTFPENGFDGNILFLFFLIYSF